MGRADHFLQFAVSGPGVKWTAPSFHSQEPREVIGLGVMERAAFARVDTDATWEDARALASCLVCFVGMNRSHRLFLALWPDAEVTAQLAAHTRDWAWPAGCAVYAPADWHVTLHFIGNVAIDRLQEIVAGVGMPVEPFALVLERPGLWHPGLAVLCPSRLPPAMQSLHGRLGRCLQGLGLAIDARPYRPHVTLARHAIAAMPPASCRPVTWNVRSFALVVSTGDKDGRYQVIREYG